MCRRWGYGSGLRGCWACEMLVCRLCHKSRELRKSHIVPEFLYTPLYNEERYLMGINGRGNLGWKKLQRGLCENLFCDSCEQHFNKVCEQPFLAHWVKSSPLPNPWPLVESCWVQVDYSIVRLFHLSVLFRTSVSKLPTFREVSLGPFEEKLRLMLLNGDPGEFWEFPIFGLVLINSQTREVVQLVSQSQSGRFADRRCYAIAYGGVQWWVGVSAQRSVSIESVCLQADGKIGFGAIPWNELGVVKSAAMLLKQ